jgi:hypothetical protein
MTQHEWRDQNRNPQDTRSRSRCRGEIEKAANRRRRLLAAARDLGSFPSLKLLLSLQLLPRFRIVEPEQVFHLHLAEDGSSKILASGLPIDIQPR